MTDFQLNLYKFIANYLGNYNRSPSFNELTAGLNLSPRSKSLITRSLRALSRDGKVTLKKEGRRLLISLPSNHLPLVGRISAGSPIEAIPEYQSLDLNELLPGINRFALRVKGDSMIEDGIYDGDIIICKQTSLANENEIVIALIDQTNATLKRVSYKMKDMITLIPSNKNLKPRAYSCERIQIQGVYVGLIRINS